MLRKCGVSDVSCACLTEDLTATEGQCLPDVHSGPSHTITDIPSMFTLCLLALLILHARCSLNSFDNGMQRLLTILCDR